MFHLSLVIFYEQIIDGWWRNYQIDGRKEPLLLGCVKLHFTAFNRNWTHDKNTKYNEDKNTISLIQINSNNFSINFNLTLPLTIELPPTFKPSTLKFAKLTKMVKMMVLSMGILSREEKLFCVNSYIILWCFKLIEAILIGGCKTLEVLHDLIKVILMEELSLMI